MAVLAKLILRVLPDTPIDDAILDAIALSACSDGMANSELVTLLRIARELPSLKDLPPEQVDARVHASFARLGEEGFKPRLAAVARAAKDATAKRRMFCAAAIVQYADGHVSSEENEFLLDLAMALGLDDATVAKYIAEIEREIASEPL